MQRPEPYWTGGKDLPASAFAVIAVTLIMVAIAQLWPSRPVEDAFVPQQHASLVFPYQGQEWVAAPVSETLRTPDDTMARVDTRNGVGLYTPAGGGGGSGSSETLFVRLDNGMYLPLTPRGATHEP